MKKTLLFLTVICISTQIDGMKRARNGKLDRPNKKKHVPPSPLLSLPVEIQSIIFEFMTNKITPFKQHQSLFHINETTGFKPREATAAIRSLSHVNKFYNHKINDLSFTKKLIQNLSATFFCTNETIARSLATRVALQQLELQIELKHLCLSHGPYTFLTKKRLDYFREKNVNLDFTYNHQGQHLTPLMLSLKHNTTAWQPLLDSGANINAANAYGITPLIFEAEFKIWPTHIEKILAHPNIIVDQQNKWGESPLLRAFKAKNRYTVSAGFISLIRQLLEAGADPKLADKYGNTALSIAQFWQDLRILQLIETAIEKKTVT